MSKENDLEKIFKDYYSRTFYKTASLIANSCKGIAIAHQLNQKAVDACFNFGKNLGLAFQFIDDVLDYVGDKKTLGKPQNLDLKEGIVTAPVMFISEEVPEIRRMMSRKFR